MLLRRGFPFLGRSVRAGEEGKGRAWGFEEGEGEAGRVVGAGSGKE